MSNVFSQENDARHISANKCNVEVFLTCGETRTWNVERCEVWGNRWEEKTRIMKNEMARLSK